MQLFGFGAKTPQPQALPAAPAVDPTQVAEQQRKAAEERALRSAGGRASTILAGGTDTLGGGSSVSKQLMAG